jgi:sodium/potassium/calcium exchanger 6
MPPRLAGVTLLALGNGAPDLSSSIAAVKSGHPHIALGSLIGSVMFVGCVVAGRLISLHENGVKSRGAQIRDVLALLGAVVSVTWILFLGKMTYGGIIFLIGLYGTYVLVVAIADFSKRAGVEWMGIFRLCSSTDDLMKDKTFSQRLKIALLPESASALEHLDYETLPGHDEGEFYSTTQEGRTSSPDSLGNSSELEMTESPRKKGPVGDRNTWAPNSSNQMGGKEHKSHMATAANLVDARTNASGSSSGVHRATTEPAPSSVAARNYDDLVHMSAREYRARALADMSDAKTFIKNMDEHHMTFSSQTGGDTMSQEEDIYDEIEQQQSARREDRGKHVRFKEEDIRMQQPGSEEQLRRPGLSRSPSSILFPNRVKLMILYSHLVEAINVCITPATYLLKATVPLLEQTSYNRTWFLLSFFFSPFWTLFIFESYSMTSIVIAFMASLVLVFIAYLGTASLDPDTPPFWDFGTGFPIGSSIVALYGFALAATWIDKIATEIVSIVRFFGILGGVSPAILGLTVLAWGNSLTDFFSNISMAGKSKDGVSMAMTACFAGPLFNLLIGLGVGFLALFTDTGTSSAPVPFDLIVLIGCIFAVVNCLAVVITAIHHGMKLPSWSGWVMMAWYAIYMLVTCIVEWSSGQNK